MSHLGAVTISVAFPKLTINVGLVGHNSLTGGLCETLIEKDLMKNLGVLQPEQIVFVIERVQSGVNLYDEVNKVRDLFKIDEKKIIVVTS